MSSIDADDLEPVVRRAVRAELYALVFALFWTALSAFAVYLGAMLVVSGIGDSGLFRLGLGGVLVAAGAYRIYSLWWV